MKRHHDQTDDDDSQIYKHPDLFATQQFCQHGRLARNCKLLGCYPSGCSPFGGFVLDDTDHGLTPINPLTENAGVQTVPTDQPAAMPGKRKRTVTHQLNVQQPGADEAALGQWNPNDINQMTRRSLALMLSAVGFDSATSQALESFRMLVEEYILHFLRDVKTFMEASHRNQPIPHDFAAALTRAGLTPSSLLPHLEVPFPPEIVQPALRPRSPEPSPLPSLDALDAVLGEDLSGRIEKAKRRYIPAHLPDLPPKHTWQRTYKVKERETDPIKIREKLVEESRIASENLRKLDAALREADRVKAAANPRPRTQREEYLQPIWEQVRAHVIKRDEEAFKKWKEERGIEGHHHFGWSLFGAGDAMYDPKNQIPIDIRDGPRIRYPNQPGRR